MDNDLSKCKVGDWIATIQFGWIQIDMIGDMESRYPISTAETTYTSSGKHFIENKVPSAFVEPPEWLLEYIGPKPCEFKKDELVIVWDDEAEKSPSFLEYFCRMDGNHYLCYQYGKTSITSQGRTHKWTHCRKAIEGEDY